MHISCLKGIIFLWSTLELQSCQALLVQNYIIEAHLVSPKLKGVSQAYTWLELKELIGEKLLCK